VVVGGGPTGVEVAAELHDMIYDDLKDLYPKVIKVRGSGGEVRVGGAWCWGGCCHYMLTTGLLGLSARSAASGIARSRPSRRPDPSRARARPDTPPPCRPLPPPPPRPLVPRTCASAWSS
jgi:hypothetical protein